MPHAPANGIGGYGSSVPTPNQSHLDRGYGSSNPPRSNHINNSTPATGTNDFAMGNPNMMSPLSASLDAPGSVLVKDETYPLSHPRDNPTTQSRSASIDGTAIGLTRSASSASTAYGRDTTPSRSGTLKKRTSMSRKASLRRSGSRKSLTAGSIKGVPTSFAGEPGGDEYNSALFTPIPTHGSPTEVLANRFQGASLSSFPTPSSSPFPPFDPLIHRLDKR